MRDKKLDPIIDMQTGRDKCRQELAKGREHYKRGPNKYSLIAASKFIVFLQEKGEIEKPVPKLTPAQKWPILGNFRSWMKTHRGIKDTTLDLYETVLGDFVEALGSDPKNYTPKLIRAFVLRRAKGRSISRAQGITVAMRTFIRYLSVNGMCGSHLVHSIPSYSAYRLQKLSLIHI